MRELLFYTLILLAILGLSLHYWFLSNLKKKYPDIWESLGRPTLFTNNSISNSINVFTFLLKRTYGKYNDINFVKLCDILRIFNFVYLTAFLIIGIIILSK